MSTVSVSKTLSKNDAGVNSSKEHGILIPKHPDFQSFFPQLDASKTNPKTTFQCEDSRDGTIYELNYTYYNNTKNEYRLTRANKFLKERGAVEGSVMEISKAIDGRYYIDLLSTNESASPSRATANETPLSLSGATAGEDLSSIDGAETQALTRRRGWLRRYTETWTVVKS